MADPHLASEPTKGWERRLADLWASFEELPPAEFMNRMDHLAAQRDDGDAIALFELASAKDSLGRADEAAPLYMRALDTGLAGERRRRAVIQLASTLRNLGHPHQAVALLTAERNTGRDDLDDAVAAFLALALVDTGEARRAAALALGALAKHLPRYNRSLDQYAQDIGKP